MFVYSIKATKKLIFIIIFTILSCISILCCSAIIKNSTPKETANCKYGEYFLLADTIEAQLEFCGQFGYKTTDKPIYHSEIIIPEEFSDVYEGYNKIQAEQGLDLSRYKGKTCQQYTYKILNWKSEYSPVINLIVYEGYVIGGDVSSQMLNGFMQGFYS